ncbi:hypothetical protein Tco_1021416, partial [Tanacetum coccineum]
DLFWCFAICELLKEFEHLWHSLIDHFSLFKDGVFKSLHSLGGSKWSLGLELREIALTCIRGVVVGYVSRVDRAFMVVEGKVLNDVLGLTGVLITEFATNNTINLVLKVKGDVIVKKFDLKPVIDAMVREFLEEFNGVPIAFMAGFGVISKSANRISVFHGVILMDTPYGRRGIRRIGNCLYVFSCEELALIRRISFPGYGVLYKSTKDNKGVMGEIKGRAGHQCEELWRHPIQLHNTKLILQLEDLGFCSVIVALINSLQAYTHSVVLELLPPRAFLSSMTIVQGLSEGVAVADGACTVLEQRGAPSSCRRILAVQGLPATSVAASLFSGLPKPMYRQTSSSIPCLPECNIVGQILLDHPLSYALTAIADVPTVFKLDTQDIVYIVDMFRDTIQLPVETPDNLFVAPVNIETIESFMHTVGYQGVVDKVSDFYIKFLAQRWISSSTFTKLIIADLIKKFSSIPPRLEEGYHFIRDDIPLVSVYTTGNVTVRGMLISDVFLTMEIHATDDYKEYEMVFVNAAVPMNQPQSVISTKGMHRFDASMIYDEVDDSRDRIEPESHKEHPEVVDDDADNKEEKKDEKEDDEMGSLETRIEKI